MEAARRPLARAPPGVWHTRGVGAALLPRLCRQYAQVGRRPASRLLGPVPLLQTQPRQQLPACGSASGRNRCPRLHAASWLQGDDALFAKQRIARASAACRIMMSAGIRRQRLSTRDWAVKALLDEFAAACAQVRQRPKRGLGSVCMLAAACMGVSCGGGPAACPGTGPWQAAACKAPHIVRWDARAFPHISCAALRLVCGLRLPVPP